MDIKFEREVLYQEVWATPISTLSKKYGISDNGLRKVCIALAVPLPPRGHWAKIAAGQKLAPPSLPTTSGRTIFFSEKSALEADTSSAAEQTGLEAQIAFEEDPQNAIVVDAALTKPHRLVVVARQAVEKRREALLRSRDQKSRPHKPGEPWRIDSASGAWQAYERCGHIDLDTNVLPLRVSLDLAERALRVWNAVIQACEARHLTVSLNERVLKISDGANYAGLRMSEKLESVTRLAGSGRYTEELKKPTGCLRLFVVSDDESKFEDKRDCPIEMQLNDVLKRVYRSIEARRLWNIEIDRRMREMAEAKSAHEEALAAKGAQQLLIEQQRERERALVTEAEAWREARVIREYITHLKAGTGAKQADHTTQLQEWITWAETVADKLDPTTMRLTGAAK